MTAGLISTACTATAAYQSRGRARTGYAIAAALSFLPSPFTLLALKSTNDTLIRAASDAAFREKLGEESVKGLLKYWRELNFVRSGLAFIGGAVGAYTFWGEL